MSRISKTGWTATADSVLGAGYEASRAIDSSESTFWHSGATYPHELIIDMGAAYDFDYVAWYPRLSGGATAPSHVEVYVSTDGVSWGSAVASGDVPNSARVLNYFRFTSQNCRYFKLKGTAGAYGGYMAIAEVFSGVEDLTDRLGWAGYASSSLGDSTPFWALIGDNGLGGGAWIANQNGAVDFWVDMGEAKAINRVRCLPSSSSAGYPLSVEVYLSDDGTNWGSVVASAVWDADLTEKRLPFTPATKRWVKLAILTVNGGTAARINEFWVDPVPVSTARPMVIVIC